MLFIRLLDDCNAFITSRSACLFVAAVANPVPGTFNASSKTLINSVSIYCARSL